jgi:hypothetical protein
VVADLREHVTEQADDLSAAFTTLAAVGLVEGLTRA